MKRSAIQRKTPLKARQSTCRAKQDAQKGRRKVQKAPARWRSPEYLAFVRMLPCCVCGAPADAAHHLIGIWQMGGMGLKAPDSMVMPVCDGPGDTCHRRIHSEAHLRRQQPVFMTETILAGLDRYTQGPTREALTEALEIIKSKEAQ